MNAKKCMWRQQDPEHYGVGTYETSCGHLFSFVDGGCAENEARFCQYCGGEIVADEFSENARHHAARDMGWSEIASAGDGD